MKDHLTDPLIEKAARFATRAHAGQARKYTAEAYIEHPRAVADLVATVTRKPEVIAAAWLHDVLEDTPVTMEELERIFGPKVASLVDQLTDVSRPQDGNRKIRKALDRDHLAGAQPDAQTVKLADLCHNSKSITLYDPGFARIYMAEKRELLQVLTRGDKALHDYASSIVNGYFATQGKNLSTEFK